MPSRTTLVTLAAGAALPALANAGLKAKIRYDTRAMMGGDVKPLLFNYARDATLTFPGNSSWGRTYRGKDEIAGFLQRFLDSGIRGEIEEIVVNGPPWRQTVAIRFNDVAKDPEGRVVYENRAVIVAELAWFRIRREEVYEDTEKAAAFDAYMEGVEAVPA